MEAYPVSIGDHVNEMKFTSMVEHGKWRGVGMVGYTTMRKKDSERVRERDKEAVNKTIQFVRDCGNLWQNVALLDADCHN